MSICCGEGEAVAPGACISCCAGDTGWLEGELAGTGIPGMCVVWDEGVDAGDAAGDGITISGVCPLWPGTAGILVGLLDFALTMLGRRFALRDVFRFGVRLGLGFGLLIPGILWPSCCENTV
ncbi:MAG: hypothetical protein ACREBG_11040 [Pyrinomonadaceae bacterium]